MRFFSFMLRYLSETSYIHLYIFGNNYGYLNKMKYVLLSIKFRIHLHTFISNHLDLHSKRTTSQNDFEIKTYQLIIHKLIQ